jgi:hypothetical protein
MMSKDDPAHDQVTALPSLFYGKSRMIRSLSVAQFDTKGIVAATST